MPSLAYHDDIVEVVVCEAFNDLCGYHDKTEKRLSSINTPSSGGINHSLTIEVFSSMSEPQNQKVIQGQ